MTLSYTIKKYKEDKKFGIYSDKFSKKKMEEKKIISPCISICKKDYNTGYCYGCARTDEEKLIWKDEKTNDEWKNKNIDELIKRMTGWQLDSFKESYEHKIKTGVSIFKKNQIKK